MLKMTTLTIALALAAAFSMPSSQGGEPSCGGEAQCGACPNCNACGNVCCPQCGCHEGLVPVCHQYWTTKKVVKYCYKCTCEEICLPGPCGAVNDGFLGHLGCKEGCGCQEGCGSKESCGSGTGCGDCCHCRYREVHHLVKCPYTVEVCVRKCKIEWVCPHCHCDCGCTETEMPSLGAPTSGPSPPSPPSPPAAGKTTATDLGVPQTSAAHLPVGDTAYSY
ncbi:MAG TPA: hypothetical protein VHX65_00800 [Pirellulales bacterium]|jgi:hypothetical protein|nr:hypothetical protein [Pirellulales bacterium]